MSRTDAKLERLAASGLCPSARDLLALGRLSDLATVPSGAMLQREGGREPWPYCVLEGAVLLSSSDEPVAVAGPGAWVLGQVPGRRHRPAAVSAVAGTDLEVLAFRPHDLDELLGRIPGLAAGLRV